MGRFEGEAPDPEPVEDVDVEEDVISTQEEVEEDQVGGGARWEEEEDAEGAVEDEDIDMVELPLGCCCC